MRRLLLACALAGLFACGGGGSHPATCGATPCPDAAADAAPGTCTQDSDCHKANPDVCNICPAGQQGLVCVNHTCQCACNAH